jgi:hypothetical protein
MAQANVQYQNDSIDSQTAQINTNISTYVAKYKYQDGMYQSVKYVNQFLMVIYGFFFIFIHLIFLREYVIGIKRDEIADTIWITFFFFYPYFIYPLEKKIYSGIKYVLALIYGTTYVYQFDQWLMFMDFYKTPYVDGEGALKDGTPL